jgi:hypothetical protein
VNERSAEAQRFLERHARARESRIRGVERRGMFDDEFQRASFFGERQ